MSWLKHSGQLLVRSASLMTSSFSCAIIWVFASSEICMMVPALLDECTLIFPLWYSSTILLTSESPSPQPLFFEVKRQD